MTSFGKKVDMSTDLLLFIVFVQLAVVDTALAAALSHTRPLARNCINLIYKIDPQSKLKRRTSWQFPGFRFGSCVGK